MNTIGYRNRFYQPRQTWPQLDPPKACPPPQAARNEQRTDESNEQSPPPVTRETPDSANSLDPSSKVPPTPPPRDTENSETSRKSGVTAPTKNVSLNDETVLTLIDSELFRNGQPTWAPSKPKLRTASRTSPEGACNSGDRRSGSLSAASGLSSALRRPDRGKFTSTCHFDLVNRRRNNILESTVNYCVDSASSECRMSSTPHREPSTQPGSQWVPWRSSATPCGASASRPRRRPRRPPRTPARCEMVDALFPFERLRARRSAAELDYLRIASERLIDSMIAVFASARPGKTKKELADQLREERPYHENLQV